MPARSENSSYSVSTHSKMQQGMVSRDELLARLVSNPKLPSPPPIALQIIEIVSNPDCQVSDISNRLKKDPALAAKLLKTLNSCVYGLSRPVSSVERAVTILGFHPLRSLILGLTLPAIQVRMEADAGLKQFWKESVGGAIIARDLAQRFHYPLPEDFLVASLVRDLGMILFHQTFSKTYQPLWSNPAELWGGSQCEWEEKQIGVHHAEASAALLRHWRLPNEIVLPVHYHHNPRQMPAVDSDIQKRCDVLDFSSRLVRLDFVRKSPNDLEELLHLARDRFSLSTGELEQFLKGIRPQVEEFANVLQVDIGTCPNFAEILAGGCEALIGLTMNRVQEQTISREPSTSFRGLAESQPTPVQFIPITSSSLTEKFERKNATSALGFEVFYSRENCTNPFRFNTLRCWRLSVGAEWASC